MSEYMALPEIHMVGGGDLDFCFRLRNRHGAIFDGTGCTVQVAVADYVHRDVPIAVYPATLSQDSGGLLSMAAVHIPPEDTVYLRGAFLYQVSVKDATGKLEPPAQGRLIIDRNIDSDFVTGG